MAEYGGKVTSHGVNIADAAAVDAMIESIFAEKPLTDLINNAAGNFIARTRTSRRAASTRWPIS